MQYKISLKAKDNVWSACTSFDLETDRTYYYYYCDLFASKMHIKSTNASISSATRAFSHAAADVKIAHLLIESVDWVGPAFRQYSV